MRQNRNLAALTGVAFAVLAVGGNLLQGSVPSVHGEPRRAVAFYLGEPTRISLGMVVALLGVVVLLWFLGVLREHLISGGRLADTAFAGGIVGSALLAAGLAVNAAGALRARALDTISEDVAVAFFDGSFVLMGLASATGFAATMLATGVLALRTHLLPRVVGWLSIAFAIPGLIAPVAWVLMLLFPLWTSLVGIVLARGTTVNSDLTGDE